MVSERVLKVLNNSFKQKIQKWRILFMSFSLFFKFCKYSEEEAKSLLVAQIYCSLLLFFEDLFLIRVWEAKLKKKLEFIGSIVLRFVFSL